MNYIDPDKVKIKEALDKHKIGLLDTLKKRVSNCQNESVKNYLTNEKLTALLVSRPKELVQLNNDFYDSIDNSSLEGYYLFKENAHVKYVDLSTTQQKRNRTKYNAINKVIRKIFNYENSFSKKHEDLKVYRAYKLAEYLKIDTCIYCNRLYTKTVSNPKKITRPEFDHWFPKSRYPLLALSFFNLIPSCHVCNSSVKGNTDFAISDFVHPYLDKKIGIKYSYENTKYNTYRFKINHSSLKEETTIKAFKLKEIYETHEDEIKELLKIRKVYSNDYLKKLATLFDGLAISEEEIYRLAFGTYLDEDNFEKRPLSRMKRDILREIGIIK